jgi:hypothetical protein
MKKFLVLYRMDAGEMQKMMANTTPEQRKKGMAEWDAWMKKKSANFADRGGPAGKTKKVAASGVSDTRNDIGGYSIVQADSYDAAAALFTDSPHLMMPGATVEVMEITSMGT